MAVGTILACAALWVVDGDTLKCDGQNLRLLGPGAPNRDGFDAPETWRPDCARERKLGQRATRRVKELVRDGVTIRNSGVKDRWGRPLVWAETRDGRTVGEVLLDEGLAQRWPGNPGWCQ